MSFLSFNQKELSRILGICNLVSPKKSEVDLFTYTKFEVKDGLVEISAINASIFYHTTIKPKTIEVSEDEKLTFLIKTDLVTNAISLIQDELVGLEIILDKHTLSVQGAKSKHNLRINTALIEDFKLPELVEEEIETIARLDTNDLIEANKIAATSVGNPKVIYEPQFLNICYTLAPKTKEVLLVSTDKYRLAKLKLVGNYDASKDNIEFPKNYLLHPSNLSLLSSCTTPEDEVITMKFGQSYLWVALENATLTIRYGSGNFPEYEKIIPQSFGCSFHVETEELLGALKQVYFAARTNTINKTVTIKIGPAKEEMIFESKTEDGNSSQATLTLHNYEGVEEDWEQSFNADYLIDYISTLKTEQVLWEANPGKPSVLSPQGAKEKQMCLVSGLR